MYLASHSVLCHCLVKQHSRNDKKKKKIVRCQCTTKLTQVSSFSESHPSHGRARHQIRDWSESGRSRELLTPGTMTHAGRAASSPEIFRPFLTVCLTVFPFEFRPRTFTIGFHGKKSFISELLILECSFPLSMGERQNRPGDTSCNKANAHNFSACLPKRGLLSEKWTKVRVNKFASLEKWGKVDLVGHSPLLRIRRSPQNPTSPTQPLPKHTQWGCQLYSYVADRFKLRESLFQSNCGWTDMIAHKELDHLHWSSSWRRYDQESIFCLFVPHL